MFDVMGALNNRELQRPAQWNFFDECNQALHRAHTMARCAYDRGPDGRYDRGALRGRSPAPI